MTNSALVLAVFLSVGAVHPASAAVSSSLNEHLKPIGRYVGDWTWQWKDEHGEPKTGQSIVEVHPSGAFMIDRAGDVHDGKLVTSELNIFYWRAELNSIATVGFTSEGDRGTSLIAVKDGNWVENSSGYDDQGKLRTHIDHWKWLNTDSAEYQETHVFRAGQAEPDDTPLTCKRATAPAMLSDKSAERLPLSGNLKPLARLAGKWRTQSNGEDGSKVNSEFVVEPDRSGAFVTATLTARNGSDDVVWSEFSVFYAQPESKSLAQFTFDGAGGRKTSALFVHGNKWIEHVVRYKEGQISTSIDQWAWQNDDTVEWQSTHIFSGGENEPDGPTYTLQRVRE